MKTLILFTLLLVSIQQSFNRSIINSLEDTLSEEIDEDKTFEDESETDLRLISILMDRIVIDHIDHIIDNRLFQREKRLDRVNHYHNHKSSHKRHRQHHGIPIPRTG